MKKDLFTPASWFGVLQTFLNKGHDRTVKAKKNILALFGIRSIGLAISFIKVPIILSYLDVEKYGVWLTIASIVDWVHYFDMGIGHGFRNRLTIALAENNHEKASKLVSTAYYYIILTFLALSIIIVPLLFLLDWQAILNVSAIGQKELLFSVLLVYTMFLARFVFDLFSMILKAYQLPAIADSFLPLGSILSLGTIMVLGLFSSNSLFLACVSIAVPPVLVVAFANIIGFRWKYRELQPRLSHVEKSMFREIFSLGIKFFVIQLAGLVMFSSSNIILTQMVNPSEVTVFNTARQYFGLPYLLLAIILTPYWSAITDAYTRNEFDWIKNAIKKLRFISVAFAIIIIFMFVISKLVFSIWLNDKVLITTDISISLVIMNLFLVFFAPYSSFINGVGKLNLSIRVVLVKTIIFLPVALILTNKYSATGLILSLIIINSLPSSVIEYLQYTKIINKKAYGVWNK